MGPRGGNNKALAARKWAREIRASDSDLCRNAAGMENTIPAMATAIIIRRIVNCMRGSRVVAASRSFMCDQNRSRARGCVI